MKILILNPNTSEHITERMVSVARPYLPHDWTLIGLTATHGPKVVNDPSRIQEATQTVRTMAREQQHNYDGLIIGISLDCGLDQVRREASVPVIGMTEAACLMACAQTHQFGLVTLGGVMAQAYENLVQDRGLGSRLTGVQAPELSAAFESTGSLVEDEVANVLTERARDLVDRGAQSIVLAGAVLCGYAAVISEKVKVPVFDGASSSALLMRSTLLLSGRAPWG